MDALEERKLELEIQEREWGMSLWGRATKFAPFISVVVAVIGIFGSVYWYLAQERLENERLRQAAITSLKRDFASNDQTARVTAAVALADYPDEAMALLSSASNLGAIKSGTRQENAEFTNAVKDSLRQMGADVVPPLLREVRRLQRDVVRVFDKAPLTDGTTSFIQRILSDPLSLDRSREVLADDYDLGYVREKLPESDFKTLIDNLLEQELLSLVIANKNAVEVLATQLRAYDFDSLDLSGLYLSGDFSSAYLRDANLSDARLEETDFSKADLTGADLRNADLQFANFSDAALRQADLSESRIDNAIFLRADFFEAKLAKAMADHADFKGATISDTDLSNARLFSVKFTNSKLNGANLSGAYLNSSDLSGADLTDADFHGAVLRAANLSNVIGFREIADLTLTNLKNVKGLSPEDMEYAKSTGAEFGDRSAVPLDALPSGITLPVHLESKLEYDPDEKLLIWRGRMSREEETELRELSDDVTFSNAVFDLSAQSYWASRD